MTRAAIEAILARVGEGIAPCAHCGHDTAMHVEGTLHEGSPEWMRGLYVHCHRCTAIGPSAKSEPEAIAAWNRRTSSPATIDALVALVEGAVAEERERCAAVAETLSSILVEKRDDQLHVGNHPGALTHARCAQSADTIATAIRGDRP